jgi:transposase
MDKYIGFDMDKRSTVICVYEPSRDRRRFDRVPTDLERLRSWLKKERRRGDRLHVTFEVGGQAGYFHDGLQDVADSVTVSNPTKMTWIYRTWKKNDRIDAEKQAVLLALKKIPRVHMPRWEIRMWRGLIVHRKNLVQERTRSKNQIRAQLRSEGLRKPFGSHYWSCANRRWMAEVSQEGESPWHWKLRDLLERLELVERQICETETRLNAIAERDPRVALLQTIPGVGPRTAEAVVAYCDDIDRFRGSKEFAAYFGVTPTLDESGGRRRVGSISKHGPSGPRWLLVESAWHSIRCSPALKSYYERVRHGQTGRKKIALVAVARKILCIMYAMLKTGQEFDEALVLRQEA